MLRKDCDRKVAVAKRKKNLIVVLMVLGAKTN
jgi:hypothetical protein